MPWNSFQKKVKDSHNKHYKMLLKNVEENLNIKFLGHNVGFFKFVCMLNIFSIKISIRFFSEFDIIIQILTERIIRYERQRKCAWKEMMRKRPRQVLKPFEKVSISKIMCNWQKNKCTNQFFIIFSNRTDILRPHYTQQLHLWWRKHNKSVGIKLLFKKLWLFRKK